MAPQAAADPGGIQPVFYVTNTNDSGEGSLREAIQSANGTAGDDVISITVGGQLTLASALPTLTSAVTIDAPTSPQPFVVDGQDFYPGLRIGNVPATINGLVIQHARTFGNLPGAGIASDGSLTLNSVTVRDSAGGGNGGGVSAAGTLIVSGGLYERNSTTGGSGGGFYAGTALILTDTHVISNTAVVGGGAFAEDSVQLSGGRFERNYASSGGGLSVYGPIVLSGTQFISNTAAAGVGGIYAEGSGPFELTNAVLEDNSSPGHGGLYVSSGVTVTLANPRFVGNHGSSGSGGMRANRVVIAAGLFERNSSTGSSGGVSANIAVITNATFIGNSGGNGVYAGGGVGTEQATIANSWFVGNSGYHGGGVAAWNGALAVTSTVFLGNQARVNGGALVHGSGDGSIVNALFARNTAMGSGAALFLSGAGTDNVKHVTIASSTPVTTTAITTTKAIALFQNLLLANHAVGLGVAQGFVVINNALFHDNGLPTLGAIASETDRVTGDPQFVNPAADDYHLSPGSAAIDSGIDAGIGFDYDGDARPLAMGYDIGYDEATLYQALLPFIRR